MSAKANISGCGAPLLPRHELPPARQSEPRSVDPHATLSSPRSQRWGNPRPMRQLQQAVVGWRESCSVFIVVISYHLGDLGREDLCARFRVEQLTMRVDIRAHARHSLVDRPLDAQGITEDVSTGRRARLLRDRVQADGTATPSSSACFCRRRTVDLRVETFAIGSSGGRSAWSRSGRSEWWTCVAVHH